MPGEIPDPLRRAPAQVFHPSDFAQEFLDDRGQEPLVLCCKNWDMREVEEFLRGELPVDNWLAMRMSRLWGTSIELWQNLQGAWDEYPESRSDE